MIEEKTVVLVSVYWDHVNLENKPKIKVLLLNLNYIFIQATTFFYMGEKFLQSRKNSWIILTNEQYLPVKSVEWRSRANKDNDQ